MAISCVVLIDFCMRSLFRAPLWLVKLIMLAVAVQGWGIMFNQGGEVKRPGITDNIAVLRDQLHMEEMMYYYYPANAIALFQLPYYRDQMPQAAWDIGTGGGNGLSAFLLPTSKQVGLWYTSAVRWNSYANPAFIEQDLYKQGIWWVMSVKDKRLVVESAGQYALRAAQFDLHPKSLFYNYNFPEELSRVNYR